VESRARNILALMATLSIFSVLLILGLSLVGRDAQAAFDPMPQSQTPSPQPTVGSLQPGPVTFSNCRFGVGVTNGSITQYAFQDLNVGWYVNWGTSASPIQPPGVEFVQMIRLHQVKEGRCRDCYTVPYTYTTRPDMETLQQQVSAQPGATWLIGNEMDRRDWDAAGQDEMVPELYAQAFHDIRQVIRQADPTARVAIGGMMQATPLRLKYLDQVWDHYQKLYGRRLGDDVDIWNVHGFILREEKETWGADIPTGLKETQGMLYSVEDNGSLDRFKEHILRFRQWMKTKGEQNKPLYISEYGVNMPLDYISADRVKAFMTATFDFMLKAKDEQLGYPADANRLVQRFLWYSLDDSRDSASRVDDYGEALFSSVTHQPLDYAWQWSAYVQNPQNAEASRPRVNLVAGDLAVDPPNPVQSLDPVTLTLRTTIYNNGNTRTQSGDGIHVDFWEGRPGDAKSKLLGTRVIRDINGCGYGVPVEYAVAWSQGRDGPGPWSAIVRPLPGEENTIDNAASSTRH